MEQIGDVAGKAATLHEMAWVIAQQGDIGRALTLWQESLDLSEQTGFVRFKAATLCEIALVVAQQGDIGRALTLRQESLDLVEQIGDAHQRAMMLDTIARVAESLGDRKQARTLYLQSARELVSIRAWQELEIPLGNLGALDEEDTTAFLGQALWLALHVQVPLETLLGLTSALLQKIGFDAEPAPLFATAAVMRVLAHGQEHPESERLQGRALGLLGRCAEERGVTTSDAV